MTGHQYRRLQVILAITVCITLVRELQMPRRNGLRMVKARRLRWLKQEVRWCLQHAFSSRGTVSAGDGSSSWHGCRYLWPPRLDLWPCCCKRRTDVQ